MPDDEVLSVVSVAVGSIYLVLQNVFSTVIGILGYAFMARAITQEEMGVVAGFNLLHSLIQVLVDFGLNSSVAKFVSESIGRKADYAKHVFSTLVFRLLVSLTVFLIVLSSSKAVSQVFFGNPGYSSLLTIVAVDMTLASIASLLNSVLLGSGRLKTMAFFNTASVAARWVLIITLLLQGYGLTGVFYGWVAGSLVLLMLLVFSTLRTTGSRRGTAEGHATLWSMLRFSTPVYVASMVSFLYNWYDKALILAFLPLQQLGVYNVAYTAFSVFVSIASAIGSSLLPYYGVMYGRGEHSAISDGVRRVGKYTMLLLFPLALGLASTSRQVLIVFAGRQYEPGWLSLATLSVFGLVYGLSTAFSSLLLVYGKTRTILLVTLTSTLLSIVFMPLVAVLNLVGLAVVKGVSILLSFLLSLFFLKRIMTVRIDTMTTLKTLLSSVLMAIVVLAAQQFLQGSLFLPMHVLTGVAVYALLVRGLRVLNSDDVELIEGVFGERFSRYVVRIMGIKRG
ncbi:MAG: oligosaccharide flippase family protein [Candidatus Brockarchaeota archaeon]|nr:oligosaccharide flippase family protein [Candidatus Brockarchaeota archaeon]MBO3808887.1 oligosaccharide flippase family protein [Candidatus Brockarchaeota archaeon]